jgi:tetratricopeptide (TPR) repeat protein
MFAEQFERNGTSYVYRKSQKGEAISVSADERKNFIGDFDANLRRAKWVLFLGMIAVVGVLTLLIWRTDGELSQLAIFAAMGGVLAPYLLFLHWAWGVPARALAGRTPVARELSAEGVRELRFRRQTYGQLATAALGGLAIPFIGSAHQDVFSGWGRLWLVFGVGLVTLAAVQAFRKWRFDQNDTHQYLARQSTDPHMHEVSDDESSRTNSNLWRYAPLAIIVLGLAFIGYTSAGKTLAKAPAFLPTLMLALAGWSLFTVARGISKGQIQPFIRGFNDSYDREAQPTGFWASVAWNVMIGCGCLWITFMMYRDAPAQAVQDRCYNQDYEHPPQEVIEACDQLIAGKVPLGGMTRADAFLDRAIAYDDAGDPARAIADYSDAIRLQPNYPEAYYDRALSEETIGDAQRALADLDQAIRLRPEYASAYKERGMLHLDARSYDDAIRDFTRAHQLKPDDEWSIANRGLSFAWKNDRAAAERDFAAVRAINPSNYVMLHGEAVLRLQNGDLRGAVDRLTAALKAKPDDRWAQQLRSEILRRLGEKERAQK